MKILAKKGKTSKLVRVFIQDSSSTTGAGLTGLTSASAGLVCYRARDDDGNAGATQLTLSAGTRGTWSSGGFVEKDATNQPGVYELGLDNAGLAAGSETVDYYLKGAANMAPCLLEVQLVDFDPQDAVRLGLTALPNAAAGSAGAVLTAGTGTAQLNVSAGVADANLKQVLGGACPATSVSGVPKVDVAYSAGVQVFNSDATLASATASTVVFPTTDSAGNAIPDDARYAYTVLQVVAGTGVGEVVLLTSKAGVRTFNVLSGTMPVQLDATSQVNVLGSWRGELELCAGSAVAAGAIPNAAAGAANGLMISGSNTGPLSVSGGVTFSSSSSGVHALKLQHTGGGTGSGLSVTTDGGSPAAIVQNSGTGDAFVLEADGSGSVTAFRATATAGNNPAAVLTASGTARPVSDSSYVRDGVAQGGGANTITLDSGASSVNNLYNGAVVQIRGGTGAGQSQIVSSYNGTTKVATMTANWATPPDATSVFTLYPFGSISATVSGSVTVGGYSAGQDPGTYVLATPANKLTTDAAGRVQVQSGTAAGQLSVSSGVVAANATQWNGHAVPAENVLGVPKVDVADWLGVAPAAPAVAGVPKVDVADWLGVAPNALQSGRVDSYLGAASGSVTLASNVTQWGGAAVAGALPPDSVFIRSGTAQGGGASTVTLDAGASASNNLYNGAIVQIRSGTGAGQSAVISTYNGATKVATINGSWAVAPDATSTFTLLPFGSISATVSGNVTVGGYAAGQDPASYVLASSGRKLATDVNGNVTVGGYAAGQDPYTLVAKVAMTESYTAGAFTLEQALYEIAQTVGQFSVSGTTLTVQKRDKTTTAATATLDSATSPTLRTRAS